MAGKWPYKRVEEIALKVAMGPFGSSIKVETFTDTGIPIISGQHLRDAELTDSEFNFITEEHADSLKNANVQRGDVIFTHAGNIGQVAFIPNHSKYQRYVISQRQFYLRCDTSIILPEFVVYYFKSPEGQHKLLANANQVGVPSIARPSSYLKTIEVPVPSIEEQQVVVRNIKALDVKIRANRRINQTLEAMAQAVFKSWFVDFDPVKARIAAIEQGQDPLRAAMRAISGKTDLELDQMPREHHDQLAATAALFPDTMQESELGAIPKGWQVKRVGDLIELAYGKALKSTDRQEGAVPVYGSGGITGCHNEALVPHGAIIVGRKGTVGSLYWEDDPFYPIDTTFYVKPKAVPMTYCFYAMQTLGLNKMNTDAAVPGLNRENVYRLELVKPSTPVLNAFDGLVAQIRKTMQANETTGQSLAELRDTLLPKLLSGELSVDNTSAEAATA
ncbi:MULTISPECIES: restriction endonuclease subunit S [Nitrosomonas]|uniref:Restriction modification system, type I n=1 Tax=Nitrosomonas europaea (strain ATCC 19718 / CIP 103999 / KCTC 2705 / NBRC 14298) TaxID=228410 RepID=Q82XA3_NITEU|nr:MULTISPECIES: restriction endonuclease subunit S [Nitrosomonas]CAD84295.1 Restriction modification system, type I [Nitrosomonas europaea ATCC 19718]SDW35471.1 type I restriction enzyme, S subunit [Nitrosomonas europaea]SES94132.1 type I restriction enzyme, S subunit [Nitrosomonas europaea]SJZ45556.1 type I restriction enzyme, S subunit [Nitrosomonas europaea]